MRPTKIPDHAVWEGAQRVTIGPPPGDTTGEIAAVEAVQWTSSIGSMPVRSIRCELEPGELLTLARGGHVWLSIYGGFFPPFAVDAQPEFDPAAAPEPEPASLPSKRLGLIEAVLRGHTYKIDDYHDMQVIPADELRTILGEIARRWNAPAFRDPGEEDAGSG